MLKIWIKCTWKELISAMPDAVKPSVSSYLSRRWISQTHVSKFCRKPAPQFTPFLKPLAAPKQNKTQERYHTSCRSSNSDPSCFAPSFLHQGSNLFLNLILPIDGQRYRQEDIKTKLERLIRKAGRGGAILPSERNDDTEWVPCQHPFFILYIHLVTYSSFFIQGGHACSSSQLTHG